MSEELRSQGAGADHANTPAFGQLAREHLDKGELDAARQACLEGFAENPRWTEGALLYLEVLGKLGEVEAAREVYARAITYEPLSAELRLAFAAVLEAERYPREAQRLACEAADLPAPRPPYDALLARLKALTPAEHPIAELGPDMPRAVEPRQHRTTPQTLAPASREPEPGSAQARRQRRAGQPKKRGGRSRTAEILKRPSQGFEPVITAAEAARARRWPRWPIFVGVGLLVAGLTTSAVLLWPTGAAPLASAPKPRKPVVKPPAPKLRKPVVKPPAPRPVVKPPAPRPVVKPPAPKPVVKPPAPKPTKASAKRYRRGDPRRLLQRAIESARAGKRRWAVQAGHVALAKLHRRRVLKRDELALLVDLGRVLRGGPRGARARAKDFLHEAARRPNAPLAAYLELGRVYRSLGDRARAVWCFRKATRKAPKHAEAHLELGRALWGKAIWRGMARQSLRRFVTLAPDHAKAAWAKRKLGR